MEETSKATITSLVNKQKAFFATGQSRAIGFRKEKLKALRSAILRYEQKITDACRQDLHKSYAEAYLTEISIVLQEIDHHLHHVSKWSKPRRVKTPKHLLPSSSRVHYEPLGTSLIIAPWNYPFQLLINPLVGAISAGCCTILKPSPYTPNVAAVMEEMVRETFDEQYIGIAQGGRSVNTELLAHRFDIIFFTGSPSVGKVVMEAATHNLTPVVLELGGKSPCIVDQDANLDIAAKRIAWGKTINAGQTCIAPDYLFVHHAVKEALLHKISRHWQKMYGDDPRQSAYYPRIVNRKAMERLEKLMQDGRIIHGGGMDREDRYITPTIIDAISGDSPIMQEEIFGPLLPVMEFDRMEQALDFINSREKPLALYYFGKPRKAKEVLRKSSSGGACINDTILHVANHHLPFGGVGNSGMGRYHGKASFQAFSNERAVFRTPTWIDLPLRYPPFKGFSKVRKFL